MTLTFGKQTDTLGGVPHFTIGNKRTKLTNRDFLQGNQTRPQKHSEVPGNRNVRIITKKCSVHRKYGIVFKHPTQLISSAGECGIGRSHHHEEKKTTSCWSTNSK